MPKYKQVFSEMQKRNKDMFALFEIIHNKYSLNPAKYQNEFNKVGQNILDIIYRYENMLCSKTERGTYSKFSAGLAAKFQAEVRKNYPKISCIGLEQS